MAILSFHITCDTCDHSDGYEDWEEAKDAGWFNVEGPDYIMGYERSFCSEECLSEYFR